MNLYVETSAVLAWLFGETEGQTVSSILERADVCITSDLTLIESDRALHRATALGGLSSKQATELRSRFTVASGSWHIMHLSQPVIARSRLSFPEEPIRTLDALHVASALEARSALPEIAVLSLDIRVRKVAKALAFPLQPV